MKSRQGSSNYNTSGHPCVPIHNRKESSDFSKKENRRKVTQSNACNSYLKNEGIISDNL